MGGREESEPPGEGDLKNKSMAEAQTRCAGGITGDSVFPMKNSKTQLTSGKKILWDFLSLANEYLLPLLGLLLAGYINVGNAESLLLMN